MRLNCDSRPHLCWDLDNLSLLKEAEGPYISDISGYQIIKIIVLEI